MQLPADDATTLALFYHLNSGVWSNIEAYRESVYELNYKTVPDPQPISLVPDGAGSTLPQVIEARRS